MGFSVELVQNKSIQKALLHSGDNLINNKAIKPSLLLMGSGLTLTNNEIKDIIEVIRSLENREIGIQTTGKISSQEGLFLIFLDWKNVLTP